MNLSRKTLFKVAAIGGVFVLPLLGATYALFGYYFPQLNPAAVELFLSEPQKVEDKDNAYLALIGLIAPQTVKDFQTYGSTLSKLLLAEQLLSAHPELANELDTQLKVEKVRQDFTQDKIDIEVDIQKLGCWLRSIDSPEAQGDETATTSTCYTDEELAEVLVTNATLLDRYLRLLKLKKFNSHFLVPADYGLLLKLHKLHLAKITLLASTDPDRALDELTETLKHLRLLLEQPVDVTKGAIDLIAYQTSAYKLITIATNNLQAANRHQHQIDAVLADLTDREFDLVGMMKNEFEVIDHLLCIKPKLGLIPATLQTCPAAATAKVSGLNLIVNRYYDSYLAIQQALTLSYPEGVNACRQLGRPKAEWIPTSGKLFELAIQIPLFQNHLIYNRIPLNLQRICQWGLRRQSLTAEQRQLRAYLGVAQLRPDKEKIDNYLVNDAPRGYYHDRPFIYDAANESLVARRGLSYLKF